MSAKYINIPLSLLYNEKLDIKDLSTFVYCKIHSGMNDKLMLSIEHLVKWCGFMPDRHSGKTNSKFIDSLFKLRNEEYLFFDSNKITSYVEDITFNSEKVFDECQRKSFAVLYLDEIEKIMNYKNTDGDKYFNSPVLLFVFTYLRCSIYRRPNKLRPEERNADDNDIRENDIAIRRAISPEAYNDKFVTISNKIGIPAKTISKAVDVLEELGLIVTDRPYNVYVGINDNGKREYRTHDVIFANAYKREGSFLLDSGSEYSRREIENKEKIIQRYNNNYAINKERRKRER